MIMGDTTIAVSDELKEKLDELKTGDESYNSFLKRQYLNDEE